MTEARRAPEAWLSTSVALPILAYLEERSVDTRALLSAAGLSDVDFADAPAGWLLPGQMGGDIAGLSTVAALAALTDLAITRVQVKRARRTAPVRRTRV